MIPGAICQTEQPIGCNNLFSETHNFNRVEDWFKSSGGTNATVLVSPLGRYSYSGIGALKIDFLGTSTVTFNIGTSNITSGSTKLAKVIQKDGNYIISYAFYKSSASATVSFILDVFVDGILAESRKIQHILHSSNGFVDNRWNIYYQNFQLSYGNVIDFQFRAQSNETGMYICFDRFSLEIDDKGASAPTLYSEARLDDIYQENMFTGFTLASGESITFTHSLIGARVNYDDFPLIKYPNEFINKGLFVSMPLITSDDVVKTIVHNVSGSSQTVSDGVIKYKLNRL